MYITERLSGIGASCCLLQLDCRSCDVKCGCVFAGALFQYTQHGKSMDTHQLLQLALLCLYHSLRAVQVHNAVYADRRSLSREQLIDRFMRSKVKLLLSAVACLCPVTREGNYPLLLLIIIIAAATHCECCTSPSLLLHLASSAAAAAHSCCVGISYRIITGRGHWWRLVVPWAICRREYLMCCRQQQG